MRGVIIGGGFSGLALALHLARHPQAHRLTSLHIVDPAVHLGLGAAYSTPFASHLLNVRFSDMSALAEEPTHLARWLERQGSALTSNFIERRLFGTYLQHCFAECFDTPDWHQRLVHVKARAVKVDGPHDNAPAALRLDDGTRLEADRLALCLGNTSGRPPHVPGLAEIRQPLAIMEPWRWDTLDNLPASGHVFILGSGLTMIDTVLALQERGFSGRITAMSRHGLVPLPHLAQPDTPIAPPSSLDAIAPTQLAQRVRAAANKHPHWQTVVVSLRSSTSHLWQQWSDLQKRQYVRHLKPYWEAHRHRVAPEISQRINAMRESGQLVLGGGRLIGVEQIRGQLHLTLQPRHSHIPEHRAVDCLVNCTGQDINWQRSPAPLVQSLLQGGWVVPHPLALGIQADSAGGVINRAGEVSSWLWAIGSALIGRDMESIAVPELRRQAWRTAAEWLDAG